MAGDTLQTHDSSSTIASNWLQLWRPRRRTKCLVALLAIIFSLYLFFAEFTDSESPTPTLKQMLTTKLEVPRPHSFKASHKVHTITSITTTTITAPIVTETVVVHQDVVKTPEPVVFVLITWSESSAIEGAVLIKSILIHNTNPTHLHIICDDEAQQYLETRLSLIRRPLHNVRVWFYKPTWQSMLDRIEREGSIRTDHSAGLPGLMKLLLHEILPPTVKKGIFVDTDALFITDPTLLWNVFSGLKPATAIVMSSHPDQHAPEWHHASRICSCVMLLDLEKLRKLRLIDSSHYRHAASQPAALSPPAFRAMFGLPSGDHGHYDNVRLGDQGYWWAIVDHRPDIFEPLSYDFEVTSCLLDTYSTGLGDDAITEKEELSRHIHIKDTPQEGSVILPKLLHFNCLPAKVYLEWSGWSDPKDSLNIRWGPSVAHHSGYKWIWLNKGASTLEMATIANVQFADEYEVSKDWVVGAV
ncbi:hypothetical protein DXG01_006588 [Tephrocybe rancida]|nr:hypothetical protein DXG01_006588 [Tephrocybe rancida]